MKTYTISTTKHDITGKQIDNYPGYDLAADNVNIALRRAVHHERYLLSLDRDVIPGTIETTYNKIYYTDLNWNEFYIVVHADIM